MSFIERFQRRKVGKPSEPPPVQSDYVIEEARQQEEYQEFIDRLRHGDYRVGDRLPSIFRPSAPGRWEPVEYYVRSIQPTSSDSEDRSANDKLYLTSHLFRSPESPASRAYTITRQDLDIFFKDERTAITKAAGSAWNHAHRLSLPIDDLVRMHQDPTFRPDWYKALQQTRTHFQEQVYQFYFSGEPDHQALANAFVDMINLIVKHEEYNLEGQFEHLNFSTLRSEADSTQRENEWVKQLLATMRTGDEPVVLDPLTSANIGPLIEAIQALAREYYRQKVAH